MVACEHFIACRLYSRYTHMGAHMCRPVIANTYLCKIFHLSRECIRHYIYTQKTGPYQHRSEHIHHCSPGTHLWWKIFKQWKYFRIFFTSKLTLWSHCDRPVINLHSNSTSWAGLTTSGKYYSGLWGGGSNGCKVVKVSVATELQKRVSIATSSIKELNVVSGARISSIDTICWVIDSELNCGSSVR